MEELVKSIKGFKTNKAHGLNNIPIEVWKTGALNEQQMSNNCLTSATKHSMVIDRIYGLKVE